MARDRHDPLAVAHDDVLALAHDLEAGLLQRTHGVEMIDAWDLGQGSDDNFDFANILTAQLLINDGQVFANGVPYVFKRFALGGALGPATR
jgi:hypothetical protein